MAGGEALKYWFNGLPFTNLGGPDPTGFKYWFNGLPFAAPSGAPVNVTVGAIGVSAATALRRVGVGSTPPADGWDWTTSLPLGMILTNDERTADVPTEFAQASIESTTSHAANKYYVEVAVSGAADFEIGLWNTPGSYGARLKSDGSIITEAGTDPTFSPLAAGDIIGIAADITEGKIWFRVNGGDWNNDPLQDPAA